MAIDDSDALQSKRGCGFESIFQTGLDFISERTPEKMSRMLFLLELVQSEQISLCGKTAFAVSTMQRRNGLCLTMPRRNQG